MKNIDLSGDIAGCFDAARQEAEKQPKTDVSEDVKDARSMTSEEPCDGGARFWIDLTKLDQFATEYAQDKYLPAQTTAAVIEGAIWVCKNLCLGSLSGLLTNDLTGEFQKEAQKTMAEVMANDKMIKFANEHMPEGEKQPTKVFVEKYYNKPRPQTTWKPSDEQMNTLNKVREILHYKELWNKTNTIILSYESLIRDLEQLKAL